MSKCRRVAVVTQLPIRIGVQPQVERLPGVERTARDSPGGYRRTSKGNGLAPLESRAPIDAPATDQLVGETAGVGHEVLAFAEGKLIAAAEVEYVSDKVIDVVQKLRELSPLYEMVKEGIDISKIEWQTH